MLERIEDLALNYACGYCVAPAGTYCRTLTGAKSTSMHFRRTDPLKAAWLDGFDFALREPEEEKLRLVEQLDKGVT